MMATTYKPPNNQYLLNSRPIVFLAGSIDNGAAGPWATQLTEQLSDLDISLLNPRRDDWNPNVKQTIHDPEFKGQVDWELRGLHAANVIAIFFEGNSKSPITLLEFGLYAASGKVVIACEPGFWRRGNLEVVCETYGITLLDSLDALADGVRERLQDLCLI